MVRASSPGMSMGRAHTVAEWWAQRHRKVLKRSITPRGKFAKGAAIVRQRTFTIA
jgi:ATP-dependent Zn protease